jgi:glycosyltransferase involved in cell wall biosynthesis
VTSAASIGSELVVRLSKGDQDAMIRNDLVSVVIPCYNQGGFLSEAIDSVCHQTHTQHEVIVVDDGSTDLTRSVAQKYGRIHYIYQSNRGVSAARNAGIRQSRGTYITFLDADDRLLPDALAAGIDCFRKFQSCGFVVGRYRKIASDGSPISGPNRPSGARDFYDALLRSNIIGVPATVLFRRAAVESVGGVNSRFTLGEDYDRVIAEYRHHNQNATLNYRLCLRSSVEVLHGQQRYVKDHPQYKPALRAGLANWKRHYSKMMIDNLRRRVADHGISWEVIQQSLSIIRYNPQFLGSGMGAALRNLRRTLLARSHGQ